MPSLGLHVHWHNGPTCRFVKLVVSHPLLQIVSNLVFLIFICTAMMIRVDVLTWFLLSIGDLVEQFPVVATFSRITCSFCSRYPKPMRRSSTLFLCWKRLAFQTLRESKKILHYFCNSRKFCKYLRKVRTGWMIALHRRRRLSSIWLSNSWVCPLFFFCTLFMAWLHLSITESIKDFWVFILVIKL